MSDKNLPSLIANYFSMSEIEDLCYELRVDFEDLDGKGKKSKARELVAYLERYGRLHELIHLLKEKRSEVISFLSSLADLELDETTSKLTGIDNRITEIPWECKDPELIKSYLLQCAKYDTYYRQFLNQDETKLCEFFLNNGLASRSNGRAYLTQLGVLLCCKREKFPKSKFHVHVKFQLKENENNEELWGPLLFLYDQLHNRLKPLFERRVGTPEIRDARGGEKVYYEYPEVAIIEALVNFLIHRDFSLDDIGFIIVRSDRVEFINPGQSIIPPDKLLTTTEEIKPKYWRNARLIEAFNNARFNQREGGGILRIRKALTENGSILPDGRLGLHIENDSERDRFILKIYKRHFDKDIKLQSTYPDSLIREDVPPPSYIPYPRNPMFIGRVNLLSELELQLQLTQTITITQAIAGMGGVGKTQLALAYCYTHRADYDFIWWLQADDEPTLSSDLGKLGRVLGLTISEAEVLREQVQQWLATTRWRWLLVFDNADQIEPRSLQKYLPRSGQGHVLITSRNPNWHSLAQVLEVNVFKPNEAVNFVLKRAGFNPDDNTAINQARMLAEALGYFPLALEHAAAYVETTGSSFEQYLALFQQQRERLWQKATAPDAYHATITTTWEIAFQAIQQAAPAAIALFDLCCFLDGAEIPLSLLQENAEVLPEGLAATVTDSLERDGAIAALRRYSLLTRTGDVLTIHRLVQAVGRDWMGTERAREWAEQATRLLEKAWPYDENNLATWEASQKLLPHLLAVIQTATACQVETTNLADLCNQAGSYLQDRGEYATARLHYTQALAIREKQLGADHPNTAMSLNNLGSLLKALGELAAAEPYLERALAIWEKQLGADHPDTALALNNLGRLLQDQGELAAAKPYYERALAITEKQLGADHPNTATSLNNLGGLLYTQGELAAAKPYLERVLAIWEKQLGADHPLIALALNNLGRLLQDQGELAVAKPYYERALAITEKQLGADHPHIVSILINLGTLLQVQGELASAEGYYKHASAISEKKMKADHPVMQILRNNLAKSNK